MNKLKYIRVQKQDGTYTSDIPIAPDAENVLMRNGNTLQDTIGNLDVNSADDITTQLLRKIDTENAVPVITSTTTSWLNTNVTPVGSAVVIDSSLSIAGAAADAKAVGDGLDEVSDSIPNVDGTLSISGAAADAKKTGDEITGLKEDFNSITETGETEVDRSNFVNMSGYFISGGNIHNIGQSSGTSIMYIPCLPNTKYTITKVLSARFIVAYTTETPQSNVLTYGYETHNDATRVAYTTGSDAQFLCIYYKHSEDTLTESEIYNSISVKYGFGTELTAVDKVARRAIGAIMSLASYGDLSTASGFVSAFDAAMADESISGISIPFGTYNVDTPLNITRTDFVIDGNGCTLNMRTDAGVPANVNCFVINGKNRITIRNFLINMRQNVNSPAGTAFYFLDVNQVTVENIDVFQIGCRGALIYNTDVTSATPGARKVFFKNVKLRGIDAQNTTLSEWPCGIIAVNLVDSGFEDCVVSGMCRFTLEFKNYTKNCYMKNNVIYGSSFTSDHESGIALGGDRPDSESVLGDGLVFIGNVVKNCKYPLYLGRVVNSVFSDNVLEGQAHLIGLRSCVVNGNIIKSTSKYTIPLICISGCEDLLMSENLYDPGQNELFYIPEANTNVLVKGYMDGHEINVPNPTSGTPTLN